MIVLINNSGMYSFELLNIFFTIFLLQPFLLLQQHGTQQQQVDACVCAGPDQGTLYEKLDRAEWATHIQVVQEQSDHYDHYIRYTTKFLKIFKMPAAWTFLDLENSTGTLLTYERYSCSVFLTPMREYLLAGSGKPLNSEIYINTCSSYWTQYWPFVADDPVLMEKLDSWAAQLAVDKLKKKKNVDEF